MNGKSALIHLRPFHCYFVRTLKLVSCAGQTRTRVEKLELRSESLYESSDNSRALVVGKNARATNVNHLLAVVDINNRCC